MFEELLEKNNFKVVYTTNEDYRDYNIAYVLECKNCGKKFVRSYKQLKAGNIPSCDCSCLKTVITTEGNFRIEIIEDYVIISQLEGSNLTDDFIVVSLEDYDIVMKLLIDKKVNSLQSYWRYTRMSDRLFGQHFKLYHKNGVIYDFRRNNIILANTPEESDMIEFYMTKNEYTRGTFNRTRQEQDEDGRIHGIVYHVAFVNVPDENGTYNYRGRYSTIKCNRIMYYYPNDIAASRRAYMLEQKYLLDNPYNIEPYNFMNDLWDEDSRGLYLPYMRKLADDSYIEYQKLCILAEDDPLSIFRWGMESKFKEYGIPCRVTMLLYPFKDKTMRAEPENRPNDIYIMKLSNYLTVGEQKRRQKVRCIVGRCGTYNMYNPKYGVEEELTFLNAIKIYGRQDEQYNSKDGVLEIYTLPDEGNVKESQVAGRGYSKVEKSNFDLFNKIKSSIK